MRISKALCAFLLASFFLLPNSSPAQDFVWTHAMGGPMFLEFGMDVDVDSEGNVYAVGQFQAGATIGDSVNLTTFGLNDLYVTKWSPDGTFLWMNRTGSSNTTDRAYSVNVGMEGSVYMCGYGKVTGQNWRQAQNCGSGAQSNGRVHARDALAARYRADGSLAWIRSADGNNFGENKAIRGDWDGSCAFVGEFNTEAYFCGDTLFSNGDTDLHVGRIDSSGNLLWIQGYGGSGEDIAYTVGIDGQSNIYIGGSYVDTMVVQGTSLIGIQGKEAFIAKFDLNGVLIWARDFRGNNNDEILAMEVTEAGNIYFTGSFKEDLQFPGTTLNGGTAEDVFYGKMDSAGNVIWVKEAIGPSFDLSQDIDLDEKENIYIGGYFFNTLALDTVTLTSNGEEDLWFAKFDSSGKLLLLETRGQTASQFVFGIAADPAQNIYTTGMFRDSLTLGPDVFVSNSGSHDMYVAKYCTAPALELESVSGSPFCINDNFAVVFSIQGCYEAGDVFSVELSDSSGSFANPTVIGSRTGKWGGSINSVIPNTITGGGGYRVRVTSTQPALTSNNNGFDIPLSIASSNPVSITGDTILCPGDTAHLTATPGFLSYLWSTGDTTQILIVQAPGLYWVEAMDSAGCTRRDEITLTPCVGLQAIASPPQLTAWPNPSSGIFKVQARNLPPGEWQLNLLDLSGKAVRQESLEIIPAVLGGSSKWTGELDCTELPKGFYFLQMKSVGDVGDGVGRGVYLKVVVQ